MQELNEQELNSFIKKISIKLYLASKKLHANSEGSNKKELLEVSFELKKIDKEILKKFDIKLFDATKDSAIELMKILEY